LHRVAFDAEEHATGVKVALDLWNLVVEHLARARVVKLGPAILGFALHALALWNAQYLDDAIVHLRATGHEFIDKDLQRVSPLQHEHIKMLGNFPFTLPHELAAGQRR
jgi:hypothetical protein